jgi:hypothetical protein
MKDRRSLDAVDAALDAARREAAAAKLPAELRARILAAARPVAAPAPRGRLLDFALRAAAVAAAVAAVVFVLPVSLEAAEFDPAPIAALNSRISTSVTEHLPRIDLGDAELPGGPLPFAGAAALLVGAGLLLGRRGGRP